MSFWRELWLWRTQIAVFGQIVGIGLFMFAVSVGGFSTGWVIASWAFLLLPLIFGSARQRFSSLIFILFLASAGGTVLHWF
ncbi:MAG: hypothetical protein AB7F40_00255 [Victivallaceae bacterium]|nr:hypothetical protein [Victivallaceae bacterium]